MAEAAQFEQVDAKMEMEREMEMEMERRGVHL